MERRLTRPPERLTIPVVQATIYPEKYHLAPAVLALEYLPQKSEEKRRILGEDFPSYMGVKNKPLQPPQIKPLDEAVIVIVPLRSLGYEAPARYRQPGFAFLLELNGDILLERSAHAYDNHITGLEVPNVVVNRLVITEKATSGIPNNERRIFSPYMLDERAHLGIRTAKKRDGQPVIFAMAKKVLSNGTVVEADPVIFP